ncbi:MAG: helix-turn-helix domain-containing protein [Eubacteriales bacterium]|nr:helix-turn-helix domain-containing protein [Eubacteriales bacterium]
MTASERIKSLREETGLSRKEFSHTLGIPLRTIEDWEAGRRNPPEYVLRLLAYKLRLERFIQNKSKIHRIDIVKDAEGHQVVVIHDLRFKERRNSGWEMTEECLKEYLREYEEITEISDAVYLGSDFPDECVNSVVYGWYRYGCRFAIPTYNTEGELVTYHVFRIRILVRHDREGKRYLDNIRRIKKEELVRSK